MSGKGKHVIEIKDDETPAKKQKSGGAAPVAVPEESDLEKYLPQLEEVSKVQEQLELLSGQAEEEIKKIEKKYADLKKPHYKKRNEWCSQIPGFWLQCFLGHEVVRELLEREEDQQCLMSLKDLSIEYFDDFESGYKMVFKFEKNEWFDNDVLFKEFHFTDDGPSTVCSKIKWKPNKNLIASSESEDSPSSFFVWFTEEDPDDELANVIREEIWPDPLRYFNVSGDDEGEEGEEGEDGEGEGEEEGSHSNE